MRAQQLLRLVDVFARNLAHLDQVRHDRARVAAKQPEQLLEQTRLHRSARSRSFEHVRVADFLRAAYRALGFESEYGSIEPGKRARLLAVTIPRGTDDVEEYLVSGIQPEQVRWIEP